MTNDETRSVTRSWQRFVPIAFFAFCLIAYLPAIRAGFIWDDDDYVTDNNALRSLDGLRQIWVGAFHDLSDYAVPQYYPLTFTTFWIEHHIWEVRAVGYHLINVLLHATSATILWLILPRLRIPGGELTATAAALIFALHPMQVESVAWVTERKNVLSGLLYLLSAYVWLFNFRSLDERTVKARWIWYVVSLVLFIGALLSKTVTGSLPAALPLVIWWQTGRIRGSDVLTLVPMFVLAIVAGSWTGYVERHRVGAIGPDWDYSVLQRVVIAGHAVWFYVEKFIAPVRLTFIYPKWSIPRPPNISLLWPVACIFAILLLWILRNRIGRGPLVAALFFVGTLFPALGFVNVYPMRYSFVADHFQYLAQIALCISVAVVLHRLFASRRMFVGVSVVIAMTLGVLTWNRAHAFANLESLWADTLAKNPSAWMARHNLANIRLEQKRLDEAQRLYEEALRDKPDHAEAMNGLGLIAEQRGDLDSAESWYRRAIDAAQKGYEAENELIAESHGPPPRHRVYLSALVNAHIHLGDVLEARGQLDQAMQQYEMALDLAPSNLAALNDLAVCYDKQQQPQKAAALYQRMVDADPDFAPAHASLANVMARLGYLNKAIEQWETALRLDPNDYQTACNLGVAYARFDRLDDAIAMFQKALEIKPDFEDARYNLESVKRKQAERGARGR
jgi:tetratricopeptide (TPR) repeat protein